MTHIDNVLYHDHHDDRPRQRKTPSKCEIAAPWPSLPSAFRNMFTTIAIDAFTAEGDPERYEKIYKAWFGSGPLAYSQCSVQSVVSLALVHVNLFFIRWEFPYPSPRFCQLNSFSCR